MSLGKRVRELRREQRITQRELAEMLQAEGLEADFTYISKIEGSVRTGGLARLLFVGYPS